MTKILDEVRKITAVKTSVKVLSFFSSMAEAQLDSNLPLIQAEIARFPASGMLTEQWIILQFCQFEEGRKRLTENGSPALFVRGMLLNGDGTNPRLLTEATLPMPS